MAPVSTPTSDPARKAPPWPADRFSYGTPQPAHGPVVALPVDGASWRRHAVALAPVFLAAVWIMRLFLLSSAIPAGSDMFGFVARARENSSWTHMVSVWAPSYYGAPRQFTLDLVLGLVNHLTGNPVATVKLLAFGTLFGAGAFTYLLAYRWYGSTWVASAAGLLYMTSQQSLSRWGTGQLNHEIGFALAPLLIYVVARCVDEFTVARAIGVALVLNVELLVRPDVVLWIAPFLALYPVIRAVALKDERRTIRAVSRLCMVVVPATVALNLMQILPLVAGVRAAWVSLGGLYGVQDLIDRSLDAYPSLLGFGREIGYIAFTGQQNWQFHPWVPTWIYFGAATLLVALAFGALWRHRDHRTIFLATSAVTASFLAKSVKGPVGGPYHWAVQHIPVVPNLRDPNRWLIVQALAYAMLGSLSLRVIVGWVRARWRGHRLAQRTSFALIFALLLLPVGPTVLTGLMTWRPAPGQLALLRTVEADQDTFTVATVPYDQTGRFLVQGNYRGWEHDLGADSSAFTGHPAISDGGWSQRSQDFVAFTSGLLRNHDPAFQEILGATGTKYLVKFDYPPSQPHLLHLGDPSLWQQQAIDAIPGFLPLATSEQGTVYRLASWSPLASFRPNLAIILGGPSGIAALADLPGVNLQNWAVITAPDAISAGGLPRLLEQIANSNLVVMSNETVEDLAVQASRPLLQMPGITSQLPTDRVGQQLGSDASARQGSLADQSVPVAALQTAGAGSFTLPEPQAVEVWTRIKSFPTAGQVAFFVDGRAVQALTPVSPFDGGLRWVRVYSGPLSAGIHRVAVMATSSLLGDDFEVDETRVVDSVARLSAERQLEAGLSHAQDKIVHTFDLRDVEKWNEAFKPYPPMVAVDEATASPRRAPFWEVLDTAHVQSTASQVSGTPMLELDLRPGRSYYAFAVHRFRAAQDWSATPWIFLTIDGSGSGQTYEFVASFGTGQASWVFRDDRRGLRTLVFTPEGVEHAIPPVDWSHVESVKVSAQSKTSAAALGVGPVEVSAAASLPLSLPIVPSSAARTALIEQPSSDQAATAQPVEPIRVGPGASVVSLTAPYAELQGGERVVVLPREPIEEVPATPVGLQSQGLARYGVEVQTTRSGVLMLEQGYDPKWEAEIGGARAAPLPMFSVMNGFALGPRPGGTVGASASSGSSLSYTGQRAASVGLFLSGVSWIALAVIALPMAAWMRRRRFPPGWKGTSRPSRRVALAMAVVVALAGGTLAARGWAHLQRQPVNYLWPQALATDPLKFWATPDEHVQLRPITGADGQTAVEVETVASRSFFTLLEHTFVPPQDWSARRDVFLSLRGEGSGALYQFVVYTDDRHEDWISFSFRDIQPGWRVLSFDLRMPDETGGRPDVSHVMALRMGTGDRTAPGSLALGSIAVSQQESR